MAWRGVTVQIEPRVLAARCTRHLLPRLHLARPQIWKFVPTLLPKPELSLRLRSRLASWIALACTAVGSPADRTLLVKPPLSAEAKGGGGGGGGTVTIAGRVAAARALGFLAAVWDGGDSAVWVDSLEAMLASSSAAQRQVAALVCAAWASETIASNAAPLHARLVPIQKAMLEANAQVPSRFGLNPT